MKTIYNLLLMITLITLLTSCDHNFTSKTVVHEDGSLDKTFILEQKGSSSPMLSLEGKEGWKKNIEITDSTKEKKSDRKYAITYEKHFQSVVEANAELATANDSIFQIESTFDKKFRWFYTYIRYTDTYRKINRLTLPVAEYVTPEDRQFINRLPAEGEKISMADSVRLAKLNEVLYDVYALRAFFEEYYTITQQVLRSQHIGEQWLDSLSRHKEGLFTILSKHQDIEDGFIIKVLDSLHFPIDLKKSQTLHDSIFKNLEKRTTFMSIAADGKYVNTITMPFEITSTNADLVDGKTATWRPPVVKLLINDYPMYAECRKLNILPSVITGIILMFTIFLFVRKR